MAFDSDHPPHGSIPAVYPLPDGSGETIVACAGCGVGIVPRDGRQRWCSDACRWRHKPPAQRDPAQSARRSAESHARHASYRAARKALRAAGIDPDTVPAIECLRGRGIVPAWRLVVDDVLGARDRSGRSQGAHARRPDPPWHATTGAQPTHYAFGCRITLTPRCAPHARHLHGMISRVVGEGHTQTARWALAPLSRSDGGGWAVLFFREADAARLAGTAHPVTFGARPATLSLGPLWRLRTPTPPPAGPCTVTVDAITPVVHAIEGRTRPVTQPTTRTVLAAAADVLQRCGLQTGPLHVASVEPETQPQPHDLGGHVGQVTGWVGRLRVVCNAPVAWALMLARTVGFGGRVAFGLGRVHIEVLA